MAQWTKVIRRIEEFYVQSPEAHPTGQEQEPLRSGSGSHLVHSYRITEWTAGFWLAMLSFGAIGALQIRYRDVLKNLPHTLACLNTKNLGFLQGKLNIAGIAAVTLGIIVLLTAALPWMSTDLEGSPSTGWEAASFIAGRD